MDKHQKVYKIPMKDYTPEELDELIKQWQDVPIEVQNISEEGQLNFKCPFRIDKNNNFLNCYEEKCMAFRKNSKHFWCAKLEPPKGDSNNLHPIQFYNKD